MYGHWNTLTDSRRMKERFVNLSLKYCWISLSNEFTPFLEKLRWQYSWNWGVPSPSSLLERYLLPKPPNSGFVSLPTQNQSKSHCIEISRLHYHEDTLIQRRLSNIVYTKTSNQKTLSDVLLRLKGTEGLS